MSAPKLLTHGKISLALHELRGGEGRALLLLHGLGEASPASAPDEVAAWPGPVFALDFTGHGASSVPPGGGYSPEVLMGDVDIALAEVGEVTILGRGLGGYVGLLAAGGRPSQVQGLVIADGPGLAGGGPVPSSPRVLVAPRGLAERTPDPLAVLELSGDVRPPDYVVLFARLAAEGSGLPHPITVSASERPRWLVEVLTEEGVVRGTLDEGLARYASR